MHTITTNIGIPTPEEKDLLSTYTIPTDVFHGFNNPVPTLPKEFNPMDDITDIIVDNKEIVAIAAFTIIWHLTVGRLVRKGIRRVIPSKKIRWSIYTITTLLNIPLFYANAKNKDRIRYIR